MAARRTIRVRPTLAVAGLCALLAVCARQFPARRRRPEPRIRRREASTRRRASRTWTTSSSSCRRTARSIPTSARSPAPTGSRRRPTDRSRVCVPDPTIERQVPQALPRHGPFDAGGPHREQGLAGRRSIDGADERLHPVACTTTRAPARPQTRPDPRCRTAGKGPNGTPDVMGYHTFEEIPNYWKYAERYTLQDRMFAPADSWTLPAHLFMMSGWSARCPQPNDPMSCVSDVGAPRPVLEPGRRRTAALRVGRHHLVPRPRRGRLGLLRRTRHVRRTHGPWLCGAAEQARRPARTRTRCRASTRATRRTSGTGSRPTGSTSSGLPTARCRP